MADRGGSRGDQLLQQLVLREQPAQSPLLRLNNFTICNLWTRTKERDMHAHEFVQLYSMYV